MLSYHNDPAIKLKHQARFAKHRELDQVIQGEGFNTSTGRGCFVGCTLDGYDHSRFPVELGWPEWLAHLADVIFEGIPRAEAPQFGTDLLAAVPVGVDLEPVRFITAIERHQRQLARLEGNTEPYAEQCRTALRGVIDHCQKMADHTYSSESARSARSARSAAESAARSARSAAESAESAARSARSAAESAARSARSAAESAARSARSAAESAARSARSAAESAWSAAWSAWSAAESAAWSAESATGEYQIERGTLLSVLRNLK